MPNCTCQTPRMMVFDCGSLNNAGICRSIAAQWIRKSRAAGRSINDVSELGQEQFLRAMWIDGDQSGGNEGINRDHLLGNPESRFSFAVSSSTFNAEVVARELTRPWDRFCLFAVRSFQNGGHAMASKLVSGDIQLLDPNFACWRFANSRNLYLFVQEHINSHYPDLLDRMAEVFRYRTIAARAMAG